MHELTISLTNTALYLFSKYDPITRKTAPCTIDEWASLHGKERIIRVDYLASFKISTVFVGILDALFETMIFYVRSSSYEEALKEHENACSLIKEWHHEKN